MKTSLGLLLFLLIGFIANGQFVTPEIVVTEMPVVTISVCKTEVREQFIKQASKLETEVAEEITQRKEKSKTNIKGFDEQASKQMADQNGVSVSAGDIQKMKSGKMSQEAYRAMADKMLQQSMNMSMDDAKDASKMSKSGQKAWS